jgi:hypothetical protein
MINQLNGIADTSNLSITLTANNANPSQKTLLVQSAYTAALLPLLSNQSTYSFRYAVVVPNVG